MQKRRGWFLPEQKQVPGVLFKAFPRTGEGGCEQGEQTDEAYHRRKRLFIIGVLAHGGNGVPQYGKIRKCFGLVLGLAQ